MPGHATIEYYTEIDINNTVINVGFDVVDAWAEYFYDRLCTCATSKPM